MKRSEAVLVYGVTGILVVILGIAVIFGSDPVAATQRVANAPGPLDLAGLLDPAQVDPLAQVAVGEAADPGGSFVDLMGLEAATSPTELTSEVALEVPLAIKPPPTVASLLGPNRVEEIEGRVRYRVVEVARGDTMSQLLQRWCGSQDFMAEAVALNEQIDVQRLPIGAEIWLPFVADQVLLESYDSRNQGSPEPALASSSGRGADQSALPDLRSTSKTRSSSEYVLQPGENLWVIALRRVSPRKANAYIDEILALNPEITDPGLVRSGMKILLPETEN